MFTPEVILQFFTACRQNSTKSLVLLVMTAIFGSLAAYRLNSENIGSYIIQAANAEVKSTISIPGVKNDKEIKFKVLSNGKYDGYFDGVNYSIKDTHLLPKTKSFQVSGWAISSDHNKPASLVIITAGNNNTPIAVACVKQERPDIVKLFKNTNLKNSGWETKILPSSLGKSKVSDKKIVLNAWAYDPKTKVATLLSTNKRNAIIFK